SAPLTHSAPSTIPRKTARFMRRRATLVAWGPRPPANAAIVAWTRHCWFRPWNASTTLSSRACDVEKLLDAVAAVVCLVSPEKVQAIANRIRRTDAVKAAGALSGAVSTPVAAEVVDQLIDAWRSTSVSAEELASMLLAAGHVFTKATNQQSTELVWTGPTTPFVS